jgi:hypothetical protein
MNWPQKNAKDHKENKQSKFLSMRSLCSFAAKTLPKMKSFLNLQCECRALCQGAAEPGNIIAPGQEPDALARPRAGQNRRVTMMVVRQAYGPLDVGL